MQTAFQFCEARVRETDKDRYLATLFAPERHRGPLFALYAFDGEIAHVRDRISLPLPGEVRLQWWRDILTGVGTGDAAAAPIASGLLAVVQRYALPVPALLDLIDTRTFDLYDDPMATLAALDDYAAGTSVAIVRLAARILNDGSDPGQEALACHAGTAATITAMLQRLPLHSARGQRYVPDDLLARHGAEAADLHSGRITPQLRAALAELREIVRRHLAALRMADDGVPERLLPAFLPVSLIAPTLARMEQSDPLKPPTVPQWRRQWTLWRAARDPARFVHVTPER
jgi:phytoene synthase